MSYFEVPARELMAAEVSARHRDAVRGARHWWVGLVRRTSNERPNRGNLASPTSPIR
ncbi:hypothetical protein EK0264_08630 [Epidermidibacterium keratini]|uniref:Uncharacterized protein n=1 Tax=Epidermidibacterium keratini TaxID=1891644 RepID=A0A7L4YNF1_9ACTN|nr:hypothetical protein [Epidermidibacterium keratini]QHC00339.1 hypothetical protein EK0264_08630 [Epidermidibacterium keratini]